MKMSRQTVQVLVLAVLLVVLVVFGVSTLMKPEDQTATPPPPKPQPPKQVAGAGIKKPTGDGNSIITWLDQERVPKLVKATTGGRNPFKDTLTWNIASLTGEKPARNTEVIKPMEMNPEEQEDVPPLFPDIPELKQTHSMSITLEHITPEELAQELARLGLDVDLRQGNRENSVELTGMEPDYEEAIALLKRLNVPPPAPPFSLSGILLASGTRYAMVGIHGNVYTVSEGEMVPTTDWCVAHITRTTVTLRQGNQSVSLRLAGGSPS